MAYPMLRSEGSFKRPGEYKSYVEAEALQKGKYLADMDTVFAQLNETARQFNETLSFKKSVQATSESQWDQTMAWTKEAFGKELGLRTSIAEAEEKEKNEALDIEREKLEVYRKATLGSSLRQGNIHLGGLPLLTDTGESSSRSEYKTGDAYPSNATASTYSITPSSSGEVSTGTGNNDYIWNEFLRMSGI